MSIRLSSILTVFNAVVDQTEWVRKVIVPTERTAAAFSLTYTRVVVVVVVVEVRFSATDTERAQNKYEKTTTGRGRQHCKRGIVW